MEALIVTIGGLADEWVSYALPAAEYLKGGYESSQSQAPSARCFSHNLENAFWAGSVRRSRLLVATALARISTSMTASAPRDPASF